MLVVDTKMLVYASDQDSPFHAACRAWLETQRVRLEPLGRSFMSFCELRLTGG